MKKIMLYLLLIILLVFAIPLVFTKNKETVEVISENQNIEDSSVPEEKFDYGEYSSIKLLHTETGEIEQVDMDTYLLNVVAAEMPATYEIEALKAQAVVARTYTIYRIKNGSKHEGADICDSHLCCQAWISKENRFARWEKSVREENWKKIEEAVNSTKGKYITYNGEPINAFFHSNSGGITEIPINVWGGSFPYLQSVETSGEDAYSGYSSEVKITKDELIQKMLEKYSDFQIDFKDENCIQILELNESKRVKKIKIGNKELSGVEARNLFSLKSANFSFNIIDDNIIFYVIGYGHGVGLSQSGSDSLAKQGYDYISIIKHYYKDVEISE
ncbi:MAG: stage II sporulation protein D [Candidatus Scatovivens sp.]